MARYIIKLPDLGEGLTEGEIVAWHVAPGQAIREEDPLVDVMTEKATIELPSPVAGTVVAIHGTPGERRPVGSELVELDVAGVGNVPEAEAPAAILRFPPAQPLARPPAAVAREKERERPTPQALEVEPLGPGAAAAARAAETIRVAPMARRPGEKPLASPAVRRRAWDQGIALQFVPGTGPAGRITQHDLERFVAGGATPMPAAAPALALRDGVEDVPVIGLRRAIAEHLEQAKRRIPHFTYVEEVDVTALEDLRAQLNATYAEREHLTLLPFLMRAIVSAVAVHPQVNARYDDENGVLHRHAAVHIGVATQTAGGLLVPVARHAEALDLWQSAAAARRLSETARAGKAARDELGGSTITITSLGRLGGIAATPIINHPEVAIVGVNRIVERPVVRATAHGAQIVVRKIMNLSSSFDHRIVDGWEAASFIQSVKDLLEQPALLFLS